MANKKRTSLRTISIVIPVYNEETTILRVVNSVKKANTLNLKKEIIIVNDGSLDKTARIASKIPGIKFVSHKKNQGKGAAIKSGFQQSTGDIVIIQDADLEYSPSDYPRLIAPFFEFQADAVYGTRFRGGEARRVIYFSHQLANKLLTFYSNLLTNMNLTDMECGYKAFSKWVVQEIGNQLESKRFGIEPELTARISKITNLRLYEVSVTYQGRTYAEGKKIGLWDAAKAFYEITVFNLF